MTRKELEKYRIAAAAASDVAACDAAWAAAENKKSEINYQIDKIIKDLRFTKKGMIDMKSFNKTLNNSLRVSRIKKGLSQNDLARLCDLGCGQYVSNYERNLCNVPLKKLKEISEALDIDKAQVASAYLEGEVVKIKGVLWDESSVF